ncbi:succinate-semialdehyde dehydrogenase [Variovorax paradoxus]|jgi:succinate-semialdehyde dehydrogenase/glutarate-semialdehyde dehydrogenase|uniref:NAD-dependent succinate-semialdehyde dehydrogenase n=1 Tax=Variovorax paradoxus TaxID=34073 RepID=UPI0006E6CDE9|nr:succinate-semialdehyde dehydrogenase [Variovorax paradoxus]KPV12537.1 succinate-semialdehyde dehydrogenase [Variovorax paradoxus]KPV12699.1 succinate-semialdehyde dehydrogenase [Variovorax paradoxus]KPV24864.1 succinate-semialdehyde dehydrogenase [Variovorax paradoxus]KPV35963.1 succinate-semialdehyde dehydrogenase [Variovorax paradoxus]
MNSASTLGLQRPDLLRGAGLIDGQWVAADDGATFAVNDPATGRHLADVPRMGRAETERAIAGAAAALPAWRARTAPDRARVLRRWAELMLAHQDDLGRLMTLEQGKPLAEARGEIAYAASFIEWFAEEAKRVDGEVLQPQRAGQRIVVLKQPIGVCAAITPWNFPAAMITRKVGPALAAGCTIVVKPAELTPLSAFALGVLGLEAGLPPGVLQIVAGNAPEIGAALCESPTVRKLSFTGSTGVGRVLAQQCAPTIKKLSLELGGNAPLIVFDDADIDRAIEGIVASKFRNAGQTCVCANRIYVQAGIYDAVAARLVAAVEAMRVGNGLEAGTTQGPLIDSRAVAKVRQHIDDALTQGAELRIGGKPHALGGSFFEPTVLTGVTQAMRVAREETFGPLAPLFRFETEEEVVAMANDSEFGLAAYLFTEDRRRLWRVGEQLETGMVGINTGLISNEVAPFGGVKQSGLGREGSRHGIEDYLELKYLCLQD